MLSAYDIYLYSLPMLPLLNLSYTLAYAICLNSLPKLSAYALSTYVFCLCLLSIIPHIISAFINCLFSLHMLFI